MSYITLGSRTVKGVKDTTGNNPNNWTVTIGPNDYNVKIPFFEIYHVVISGAANSTMNWYLNSRQWETTVAADQNSWDPTQPLQMIPGDILYFYWSDPVSDNTPPTVTIWMRYDDSIAVNQEAIK